MDVSVLAAVGSFVVSERVLKPKATVLICLGCVLAYDLTTKTHDPSSLRIYRGPALLAFTLMMSAYSLRTWRRNGVACDELLFLPGTQHGERHGVIETGGRRNNTTTTSNNNNNTNVPANTLVNIGTKSSDGNINVNYGNAASEGDVAAGGCIVKSSSAESNKTGNSMKAIELTRIESRETARRSNVKLNNSGSQPTAASRSRALSKGSSISSVPGFNDAWDDDEDDLDDVIDDDDENEIYSNSNISSHDVENNIQQPIGKDNLEVLISRSSSQLNSAGTTSPSSAGTSLESTSGHVRNDPDTPGPVERFRENHPRITRIGSFFFFRSSTTSTQNATYAPSGPMVVGAALDLSIPILFNFHLFIEAYNHIAVYGSEAPAKILPLIFLSVLIVRSMIPPGKRGRFWKIMRFTTMAPLYHSRFRDSFVGDVLTSVVRPLQDIMFALSYYVTVIIGTVSGNYGLSESSEILQSSWLLHNVVLPSAALLPLWWRFLQTLRESYDTGLRWPFLGNAFKYLSAAMVILYGMTHQEDQRSSWWYVCYVVTVMYQIYWDVVMDWELLVIAPRGSDTYECETNCFTQPSSFRPDSLLYTLQRYVARPWQGAWRWLGQYIPHWRQIQIRPRRLYKSEFFYWKILAYNVVFRFTWMLCFIPAYHFTASGKEQMKTFSSDTNSYIGVLLPIAELLRRTFWGFLYLEMQTIRMQDGLVTSAAAYAFLDQDDNFVDDPDIEQNDIDAVESSSLDSDDRKNGGTRSRYLPLWFGGSPTSSPVLASSRSVKDVLIDWLKIDSDDPSDQLFKIELSAWAVAFVLLGIWSTS